MDQIIMLYTLHFHMWYVHYISIKLEKKDAHFYILKMLASQSTLRIKWEGMRKRPLKSTLLRWQTCSLHIQPVKGLPDWLTFCFPGTPVPGGAARHGGGGVEGVLHQDSPFQAKVTCWSQFSRRPRKAERSTDLGTVEWASDSRKPKAREWRTQLLYAIPFSPYPCQSFRNMKSLTEIPPHCPARTLFGPKWPLFWWWIYSFNLKQHRINRPKTYLLPA